MFKFCSCSFSYDVDIHDGKGILDFDVFYNLVRSDSFVKTVSHYRRINIRSTWVSVVYLSVH